MTRKQKLIQDVEDLLNKHGNIDDTSINPSLLEFMDDDIILSIINNLLDQKENTIEKDLEWLEKFKKQE